MAGTALQVIAAHPDLVAHELVAEPERVQSVAGDGAVAQSDQRAAENPFEILV